jgi:hypothetical protein
MSLFDRLPDAAAEVFGDGATGELAYDLLTVDVPAQSWTAALTIARDDLGCTFFDWLSAVDEPGAGFRVCAHVVALSGPGGAAEPGGAGGGSGPGGAGGAGEPEVSGRSAGDTAAAGGAAAAGGPARVRRLLLRTTVPYESAAVPTATGVYPGAAWHERETHEMFGVDFPGHPGLAKLLLPEEFEGHPLRKDFVLAARVAKAWPGAKEPGESHDGGPKRRQMLPPGVPDPNEWGPLKGQLPPAPARTPRAGAGPRAAAGDRPPRRMRSASAGSASQQEQPTTSPSPTTPTTPPAPDAPGASGGAEPAPPRKRTADAPWEQPREPREARPERRRPPAEPGPEPAPEPGPDPAPEPGPAPEPEAGPAPEPPPATDPASGIDPEPPADPPAGGTT